MLRRARALGMRTTVTTNGYFLDARHLEPLRGSLDVLAISLDGPPEIHNRMRPPVRRAGVCAHVRPRLWFHREVSAINRPTTHATGSRREAVFYSS